MLRRKSDSEEGLTHEMSLFFMGAFSEQDAQKRFWEKTALMLMPTNPADGFIHLPYSDKRVSIVELKKRWQEIRPSIPKSRLSKIPAHWLFDDGVSGRAFYNKVLRELRA